LPESLRIPRRRRLHRPDALERPRLGRRPRHFTRPRRRPALPHTQDQTFWNRLRANLPKQAAALERRLNELLRLPELLPQLVGRSFTIAVDYHAIPYYGDPKKKGSRELRRGKSERGTTKFHTYATICVVVAGWRHTLAVTWVREKEKPAAVLERLWTQVAHFKIACKTALLDRYLFTVPVMKWLQNHELPFIIPVVMRGRKPKPGTKAKCQGAPGLPELDGGRAFVYAPRRNGVGRLPTRW